MDAPAEQSAEERRQHFRELIASGVSTKDAGELCGYTPRTASEYRRRDRDLIRELAIEAVTDLLPTAVKELRKLVTAAASEAVRLNAIQRVFTQAGLDVPARLDIHTMSDSELDSKLKEALGVSFDELAKLVRQVQ